MSAVKWGNFTDVSECWGGSAYAFAMWSYILKKGAIRFKCVDNTRDMEQHGTTLAFPHL